MFDKIRAKARDLGMVDYESASMEAVIGFIVMAVVKERVSARFSANGHWGCDFIQHYSNYPGHSQLERLVFHAGPA